MGDSHVDAQDGSLIGVTLGALLPTRPRYLDQIPALERAGFDEVWFPDFQLAGADPFLCMALQASRTQRLRFGVSVCNPITRHVTVVANLMATLNREFPGRVGLGVGVGASPLRALGLPSARLSQLHAFVTACRALMSGEEATVSPDSGPVRFLEFWRNAIRTDHRVPIRIAAGGPRSLEAAGAIADEVIIGTIDEDLLRIQIEHVRRGARRAGRAETDVRIAVLAAVFTREPSPSLTTLREHVGGYVPNMLLSNHAAVVGHENELNPELVRAFTAAQEIRDKAMAAAAREGRRFSVFESYMESVPSAYESIVTPSTLRAKALWGDRSEIRERVARLHALGVSTLVVFPDPKDDAALERLARDILDRKGDHAD